MRDDNNERTLYAANGKLVQQNSDARKRNLTVITTDHIGSSVHFLAPRRKPQTPPDEKRIPQIQTYI